MKQFEGIYERNRKDVAGLFRRHLFRLTEIKNYVEVLFAKILS